MTRLVSEPQPDGSRMIRLEGDPVDPEKGDILMFDQSWRLVAQGNDPRATYLKAQKVCGCPTVLTLDFFKPGVRIY